MEIVKKLNHRLNKLENIDNIIDVPIDSDEPIKSDDNFDLLKGKKNMYDREGIDILNQLYSIGIRFENIIDVNCYDTILINYIKENKYKCEGVSIINEIEGCSIVDITLSKYDDNKFDMVICLNLFEYLTYKNIKIYYENLLRISSNYIIIKINMDEASETADYYLELFNSVVNSQDIYSIQRYITNNIPKNLFILKKELINK